MIFYLIMPVGSDKLFTEKRAIIEAAAKRAEITPYFPRYQASDGDFVFNTTIQVLGDCEFVIADLSLERPSCYFELGLAQALAKPTILIAEEGTPIHQTNGRSTIRFYKNIDEYQRLLCRILTSAISHEVVLTA